jgi:hypothetical protein
MLYRLSFASLPLPVRRQGLRKDSVRVAGRGGRGRLHGGRCTEPRTTQVIQQWVTDSASVAAGGALGSAGGPVPVCTYVLFVSA